MPKLNALFVKALTPPKRPAKPKAKKKPGTHKKNVIPAALRGKKLEEADYRLLRKFMTGHSHDTVHAATLAQSSLQRTVLIMDMLHEKDTKMLTSGLLGDDTETLKKSIERQDNVRLALRGCLREVQAMRVLRLQELVLMESALEREERRQQHQAQLKIQKEKRDKQAKAKEAAAAAAPKTAEVHYEGSDEPGTPTIQIDPTLLAQATQTLRSDPDGVNAKAARDSGNRITKSTVGKVKNAKG